MFAVKMNKDKTDQPMSADYKGRALIIMLMTLMQTTLTIAAGCAAIRDIIVRRIKMQFKMAAAVIVAKEWMNAATTAVIIAVTIA